MPAFVAAQESCLLLAWFAVWRLVARPGCYS